MRQLIFKGCHAIYSVVLCVVNQSAYEEDCIVKTLYKAYQRLCKRIKTWRSYIKNTADLIIKVL